MCFPNGKKANWKMSMCSNIQSQLNHEEKKHRLQAFEAEDAWYQLSFFPISHEGKKNDTDLSAKIETKKGIKTRNWSIKSFNLMKFHLVVLLKIWWREPNKHWEMFIRTCLIRKWYHHFPCAFLYTRSWLSQVARAVLCLPLRKCLCFSFSCDALF